jgi:hypothetical protein
MNFENEGETLAGQKREEVFPDPVSCERWVDFIAENKGLIVHSSGGMIAFYSSSRGLAKVPFLPNSSST